MVIPSNNKTSVMLGLLVCALGISVSSSADARKANRQSTYQGTYVEQGYANPTPGITAMPRNTPKANVVCWTTCAVIDPGSVHERYQRTNWHRWMASPIAVHWNSVTHRST